MTDTESTPVADLVHRKVIDPAGDKVGTVFDVYLDNSTGQPEWLAVTTGLFGTKVSFVPVAGATMIDDDVMVAYPKDTVKDAPRAEADGELSADEEAALFTHYDVRSDAADQNGTGQGGTEARVGEDRTTGADEADQGHDTSGPNTDDAMTRSEEQLDVTTGTRESGKVRLRKWIETENVHMTVPVRRQKARVVVEPVTDANRDAAYAGGDLTTEEHEVVLSEEVVDVSKSVVAKERVRLETEVETGEVEVDEEVRKERIAMEGDDEPEGSGR
jgi:uncharacterized protein (TIGR02271 family)